MALQEVKTRLGDRVFGQVLLYHLQHETSLWNQSKVLSSYRSPAELGLTAWPDEAIEPQ